MIENSPEHIKRKKSFFGAAMFLRHKNCELKNQFKNENVSAIALKARKDPENWECLLMKRNYLDFCWDHIGGSSEINEFPFNTMRREVFEEVGWGIKEHLEVCRQWKNDVVCGFIYLVIPDEIRYRDDSPPRIPCSEIQTVQYFNLNYILKSDEFKANVKGRIQAFICGEPDFRI